MRPLTALCVVLLFAAGARAQSLEAAVSPAIADARASAAGQRKLAQASAAASGPAEGSDDELRRTLSDIAQRACSGGEIAPAELYALPAHAGAEFLDGRLPEGLGFGNCAGKLYVRLGLKIMHGESVSMDDLAAQDSGELPAVAAPAPAPTPVAPPAPSPAPAGPQPVVGAPSGPGAPAAPPSGADAEATARRSLEQQNRELGKYDRIVHRADGDRRRNRDRDRDRDRRR